MIPDVEDVYELARFHLGDNEVPGGQWATDNFLQPFFGDSFRSLYRYLQRNHAQRLRRANYFNLPINTSYLKPADAGIINMGQPEDIFQRKVGTSWTGTIAGVDPGTTGQSISTVDITISSTASLNSGDQVLTMGFAGDVNAGTDITEDVNDLWTITVVNATTIRLNGCSPGTSNNGATGIVSTGGEQWPPDPIPRLLDFRDDFQNSVQSGEIRAWYFNGGIMRFTPASTIRQLKIVYDLSGSAPQSGSCGINDSLDALATFAAGKAARSKFGDAQAAQELLVQAVGNPAGDTTNVTGGYFYELAQIETQHLQKVRVILPPFRQKRNTGWGIWGAGGY